MYDLSKITDRPFMKLFTRSLTDDRGANMVEYGLIVAVIALLAFAAVSMVGHRTEETFEVAAVALDTGAVEYPGNDGDSVAPAPADTDESGSPAGGNDSTGNGGSGETEQLDADTDDETGDPVAEDQTDDNDLDDLDQLEDGDDHSAGSGGTEGENDEDASNPGVGEGGDGSDITEDPAQETPAAYRDLTGTSSEFFWWNKTNDGGYGAWKASTTFRNTTNRHQYLKMVVTRIDDKGVETTVNVDGFYVPANGSSQYTLWDNQYRIQNGTATGTVAVKVQVLKVTTSDQNWQPFSFDAEPNESSVAAPSR